MTASADPGAVAFMHQAAVPFVPVTPLNTRDLLADLDAWMARVSTPPRTGHRTVRLRAWQVEVLRRSCGTDLEATLGGMARGHGISGIKIEVVE